PADPWAARWADPWAAASCPPVTRSPPFAPFVGSKRGGAALAAGSCRCRPPPRRRFFGESWFAGGDLLGRHSIGSASRCPRRKTSVGSPPSAPPLRSLRAAGRSI